MSRRAFSYPLLRNLDGEAGGAQDLQTDIMRFMAILALCLMAIFALVQSLPAMPPVAADTTAAPLVETPVTEAPIAEEPPIEEPPIEEPPIEEPMPVPPTQIARSESSLVRTSNPTPAPKAGRPPERPVVLTRPALEPSRAKAETRPTPPPSPVKAPDPSPPTATAQNKGFTLRFESDLALSRLVATGQIGFFALRDGTARRMSVSQSRSSFWAAPLPSSFHEMDAATVPAGVRGALARSGWQEPDVAWGVTLPPRMSSELSRLMREYDGGTLVIAKDGTLSRKSE